jgi:hypothetical protein
MRRVILRILLFPSISAPLPPAPFGMIHFSAASRCSACAAIGHIISSSCAFLRPASSYAVASTYQLLPHDRICLVAVCRPVVSFLQCASQIGRVILESASFPCLPPALRKSYSSRIPTRRLPARDHRVSRQRLIRQIKSMRLGGSALLMCSYHVSHGFGV